MPRLLILEFLSKDRHSQYRSESLPFVYNFARRFRIPVRWLSLGQDPAAQPENAFVMGLPADDVDAVSSALRRDGATHVLSNERLSPASLALLAAAAPAASFQMVDMLLGLFWETENLARWLGVDASGLAEYLPDACEPRFGREAGNALASEVNPLVPIIAGRECVYARPVRHSAFFAAVPQEQLDGARGCSFCAAGWKFGRPRYRIDPLTLGLRQILAARDDTLTAAERAYDLRGAELFLRLPQLMREVLAAKLPPSHFYLTARFDQLRRKRARIEPILDDLRAAGHVLHFWNVSVENLSPAENERFNKGITFDDVKTGLETLRGWERDWPDSVVYSVHGGFGYILFTPWTTLDDLEKNRVGLDALDVSEGQYAFCVTTRLVLHRGRPIAQLAERDGLLAEAFADPLVAELCRDGSLIDADRREIPWRFRNPEVAPILSFMLRCAETDRSLAAQIPHAREVARFLESVPRRERNLRRLFAETLAAVRAHPEVRTLPEILGLLAHLAAEADGNDSDGRSHPDTERLLAWLRRLLEALARHPSEPLGGYVCEGLRPCADGTVEIALRRGEHGLRLAVGPTGRREPVLHEAAGLAVSHAPDTPPDTPQARRIAKTLARTIERRSPI